MCHISNWIYEYAFGDNGYNQMRVVINEYGIVVARIYHYVSFDNVVWC